MGKEPINNTWKYYTPNFEFTKELPVESSAWSGHYFFAYDLISNTKPKVIVELGTHKGNSLFSFAQAIKDNKLNTQLHGIDTWEGDEHAGHYTEDIYKCFLDIKNRYYKDVNVIPHKMYFDDAVKEFKDNSIDILHIDGLHTYDAVKHDFNTWLPKVNKDTGIILFHDVCEKSKDFGVYKLWEELQKKYTTITFEHYHGLGVLFIGKYKGLTNKDCWVPLYSTYSSNQDLEYKLDILNKDYKNLIVIKEELENIHLEYLKIIKSYEVENKNMREELNDYAGFNKGPVWKIFKVWRKLKHGILRPFLSKFINIIKRFTKYLIKAPKILLKLGIREFTIRAYVAIRYFRYSDFNRKYQLDLIKNKPSKYDVLTAQKEIETFKLKPLISIVIPVYNVDPKWLKIAIESIQKQWYTNWEICLADDKSTDPRIRPLLEDYSKKDSRIKVIFREQNGHISECTNSALSIATGEYIALMDNDDEIYPQALYKVAKAINENPEVGLIYSDEDKIEMNGVRTDVITKPDYDPDYLLSTNYFCHFTIIKRNLIEKVGGFRKGYEGSQDYDLFLRVVEQTDNVVHIPDVLYGWRKIPGSTALKYDEKGYAENASLRALKDTIIRRNIDGEVSKGIQPGFFRVRYNIKGNPKVSIIINTTKNLEKIIEKIVKKTQYKNISFKGVKNFGELDNNIDGDYVVFLDKNATPKDSTWINNLLEHAQRENVLAVSQKIVNDHGHIIFTGFEKGKDEELQNIHQNLPPNMQNRANLTIRYPILPAIGVMLNKKNLKDINIFSDNNYSFTFVKAKNKDKCLIYTPYTQIIFTNKEEK